MSILAKVTSKPVRKPRRLLAYGKHGIGKSELLYRNGVAEIVKPIYCQFEDGIDRLPVAKTPLLKSYDEFSIVTAELIREPHDYRCIVIDTVDWLERCIFSHVARIKGKSYIEEIDYGKGYTLALRFWTEVIQQLDRLREERGMSVVLLAHAKIEKFYAPDDASYDRYEPDLHKSCSPLIQEWCDEVFFLTYAVKTQLVKEGMSKRTRAFGDGTRVMYTTEAPTHLAKRRVDMDDCVDMDFREYLKALKAADTPAAKEEANAKV